MKIYKRTELIKNNSFIITTHILPDGDAIGSELALGGLLKVLNKEYKLDVVSDFISNIHQDHIKRIHIPSKEIITNIWKNEL